MKTSQEFSLLTSSWQVTINLKKSWNNLAIAKLLTTSKFYSWKKMTNISETWQCLSLNSWKQTPSWKESMLIPWSTCSGIVSSHPQLPSDIEKWLAWYLLMFWEKISREYWILQDKTTIGEITSKMIYTFGPRKLFQEIQSYWRSSARHDCDYSINMIYKIPPK